MTGIISPPAADSLIFKATINSATLPTIASTSTVPSGKTWVAHGVCKLVEAAAYVTSTVSTTAVGAEKCGVGNLSGTDGGADSGTSGGSWAASCYCAHWCAHYCARYCALAGYGYGHGYGYGFGFGYGYGTARGYSDNCVAIGVNGSTSWTQVVPSGFTVTTWLYYEQQDC